MLVAMRCLKPEEEKFDGEEDSDEEDDAIEASHKLEAKLKEAEAKQQQQEQQQAQMEDSSDDDLLDGEATEEDEQQAILRKRMLRDKDFIDVLGVDKTKNQVRSQRWQRPSREKTCSLAHVC